MLSSSFHLTGHCKLQVLNLRAKRLRKGLLQTFQYLIHFLNTSLYLTAVTVNITCDSKCDLYTMGKLLGHKPLGWASSIRFILPLGASNLAVHVENVNGQIRFLASLSNGKVTDSSWRCSSLTADGWSSEDFDASIWSPAVVRGGNGLQGISSEAKWIGVQNQTAASFYCVLKF